MEHFLMAEGEKSIGFLFRNRRYQGWRAHYFENALFQLDLLTWTWKRHELPEDFHSIWPGLDGFIILRDTRPFWTVEKVDCNLTLLRRRLVTSPSSRLDFEITCAHENKSQGIVFGGAGEEFGRLLLWREEGGIETLCAVEAHEANAFAWLDETNYVYGGWSGRLYHPTGVLELGSSIVDIQTSQGRCLVRTRKQGFLIGRSGSVVPLAKARALAFGEDGLAVLEDGYLVHGSRRSVVPSDTCKVCWHLGLSRWICLQSDRRLGLLGGPYVSLESMLPTWPRKEHVPARAEFEAKFHKDGSLRFLANKEGSTQITIGPERASFTLLENANSDVYSECYQYKDGMVERFSALDDMSRPYPVDVDQWLLPRVESIFSS